MGSPALAIYSLTITILNNRWVGQIFGKLTYPNAKSAEIVLSAQQHVPIDIRMENSLLASLIVLKENDVWWKEMRDRALRTRHWNIPAAVNIAW